MYVCTYVRMYDELNDLYLSVIVLGLLNRSCDKSEWFQIASFVPIICDCQKFKHIQPKV